MKIAAHTTGAGAVAWQARQRSGTSDQPSWHFNFQQPGNVSLLFGAGWTLHGSEGSWTPDTYATYRFAYRPNGSNWDYEFSQGNVAGGVRTVTHSTIGTNEPGTTHTTNSLLNGTADPFNGITLDYIRIVEGQYVPAGETILVPEPAMLGMLLVGGGLMLRRRHRA
jgi:hypothetical protein